MLVVHVSYRFVLKANQCILSSFEPAADLRFAECSTCSIITKLSQATQQLLSLLFGTWFRVVQHSEFNGMSSEAMAKSVAGSLFRSYQDMKKIALAVHVVQMLIDDFAVGHMFGRDNIHYFSLQTGTAIRVREKIRYEYQYPVDETMQCK